MIVAWAADEPGTPSKMAVTESDVFVTAIMPSNMAKAGTGSISKVNGMRMARPVKPPMPGTAPSQIPSRMPMNIYPIAGHIRTWIRPEKNASNIGTVSLPGFTRGRVRRASQILAAE